MLAVKRNFANLWAVVLLVVMSTAFSFALRGDNLNLLLIGLMALSPLAILVYPEFDRTDVFGVVFMSFIVFCPLLNHPETMRWSTVLYTLAYCFTFMAYTRLLRHGEFGLEQYMGLVKFLIYAYAVVLLVQQFSVLVGLPVFNLSAYDPRTPFKLNALTSEPSHSARVMGILMYSYLCIRELSTGSVYSFKEHFKQDKWVWMGFLWTMITIISASAFLFIGIVLLKFLKWRYWFSLIGLSLLVAAASYFLEIRAMERTYKIFLATVTMNEKTIMLTDGSAAARIVPTVKLLKTVTVFSEDGLFGHGIDQLRRDRVVDMSRVGYGTQGMTGGSMTMWYDYGFIVFALWMVFSIRCCFNRKEPLVTFLFWFFAVFLFGINNQFVWLVILLMYTNKQFLKAKGT